MEYKLGQILDANLLQILQDKLNAVNPFPSALVDNDGIILTATAWQDICTKFHRKNPESEQVCIESDKYILAHLSAANPAVSYRCPHGMTDNAIPILVEGHHLGSFFTGQFFLEPPDMEFFRKQAVRYGFDTESYLAAVRSVPVWTVQQVPPLLDFMKAFIESLASMGLSRLREEEARKLAEETDTKLRESDAHLRRILENTQAGYFHIDCDGILRDVNEALARLYGYERRDEIIGHLFTEIVDPDDSAGVGIFHRQVLKGNPDFMTGEANRRMRNGVTGYHTYSAKPVVRNDRVVGIEGFIIDVTRRKLAEIDRDLTRERLSSVFATMTEAFALHEVVEDESGNAINYRYLDVNPAFEAVVGQPARDIVGKLVTEVNPYMTEEIVGQFARVGQTGEPVTKQFLNRLTGKSYRLMIFSSQKGQYAILLEDITARVLMEKHLRESEAKYKQLSDLTPEGLLVILDNVVHYANRAAALIFEAPDPEYLVGIQMDRLIHPDCRQPLAQKIADIAGKGGLSGFQEEKLLKLNGEVFYSEVAAVPFQLAGRIASQVIFNDITERKIAEDKLKTLAHAIDSIKECVSMTDTENNLIFVNSSFCQTYGYSRAELLGRSISMVRTPDDGKHISTHDILTETLGGGWSGEVINRRKDGTDFPAYISTAIVYDEEGKVLALIGIATDITERKRNEQELIAAKEKAEESDKLKSAFLANISHEIRTPMNSILGFTELLEEMSDDPQQLSYLRIISSGGERLLKIINSVIDIAKIEAGQANLTFSHFDLNTLMEELFELNKRTNPGVRLQSDMAGKPSMPFFTDKTKLFQILNNLLTNALKYTRQGLVNYGYSVTPAGITFYVKDTGIGIPPDYYNHIFERFRKVDLHDRSDFEGTGLGLAISRELARLLKGEIWFESEEGRGSVFYVRLPL